MKKAFLLPLLAFLLFGLSSLNAQEQTVIVKTVVIENDDTTKQNTSFNIELSDLDSLLKNEEVKKILQEVEVELKKNNIDIDFQKYLSDSIIHDTLIKNIDVQIKVIDGELKGGHNPEVNKTKYFIVDSVMNTDSAQLIIHQKIENLELKADDLHKVKVIQKISEDEFMKEIELLKKEAKVDVEEVETQGEIKGFAIETKADHILIHIDAARKKSEIKFFNPADELLFVEKVDSKKMDYDKQILLKNLQNGSYRLQIKQGKNKVIRNIKIQK